MTTWQEQLGARDPASRAVVSPAGTWTTQTLLERAEELAAWLDVVGAPEGQAVPALVTASPDSLALVVAGAGSGRPLAPLNPQAAPREVVACLARFPTDVVVADATGTALAERVSTEVGGRVARLPEAPGSARRPLERAPTRDAVVAVLHTSGTTGAPKAVPIRQDRMALRTVANAALLGLGPDSTYATASGLHHIGGLGMLLVALGAGSAVAPFGRFSVESWQALGRLGPTHALLVPTMVEMALDAGVLRLPGLQLLHYGGSQIHPPTVARILRDHPDLELNTLYGQTEGSPITCLTTGDHRRAAAGHWELLETVGRAVPGADVVVADPDASGIGEVWARAPHLFRTDPDGWLRTGDLGSLDREGYLRLAGRTGDRIIRGGENVHPVEVEHVLLEHPQVREVAVAGVADRRLGQAVWAWVVPVEPAEPPDPDELRGFARERLAGFKVPVSWTFCDQLPRNAAGKVLRRVLVAEATPTG